MDTIKHSINIFSLNSMSPAAYIIRQMFLPTVKGHSTACVFTARVILIMSCSTCVTDPRGMAEACGVTGESRRTRPTGGQVLGTHYVTPRPRGAWVLLGELGP